MSLTDLISSIANGNVPSVPPPDKPTEQPQPPSYGTVPPVPPVTSKKNSYEAVEPDHPNWMAWIAERCPLVPEDKTHIMRGLYQVHPRMQQRLAERYVQTWREAATHEPSPPKRENAGRRAANLTITRLIADPGIYS